LNRIIDSSFQDWGASSPEEQGIDSTMLASAHAYLVKNFPALCQLTLIRHGKVVYHIINNTPRESLASVFYRNLASAWGRRSHAPSETFQHQIGNRWNIRSVAKSITSLLVGIAIQKKLITSLDQKVVSLLPGFFSSTIEPAKREITLKHLLTMTSGLQPVESGRAAFKMLSSRDWTRFMLSLPLESPPGEKFRYNSANAHLLSAVLTRVSGQPLVEFANRHLFRSLGIYNILWGAGPEGATFGAGNLFLSADELVQIGLLCLEKGRWKGQAIIPQAWLEESLQPHQTFLPGWEFGYYWYLHDEVDEARGKRYATFSAAGSGGQKILAIPELDLVMACVAKTDFIGEKGHFLNQMVNTHLIPAVKDSS